MFKSILVSIDLSEMGEKVFNRALELAKLTQAKLSILHVLSPEEESSPLPIPTTLHEMYPTVGNELTLELWRKQWEDFEKQGLEILKSYSEKAIQEGITAEFYQQFGSPGKTICKLAETMATDVIVVGHRGRKGFSEMLLGSVSNYVLHHGKCSVLIVQTPT